jgi:hypothetical protein
MTKAKAKDTNLDAASAVTISYSVLEAGASLQVRASDYLDRVIAADAVQNLRVVKPARFGVEFGQFNGAIVIAEGTAVFNYPTQGGSSEIQMTAGQHNVENGAGHYPMATFNIVAATDCVICNVGPLPNALSVLVGPAAAPDRSAFIHYVTGKRAGQTVENVGGETFFVDVGEVAVVGASS